MQFTSCLNLVMNVLVKVVMRTDEDLIVMSLTAAWKLCAM